MRKCAVCVEGSIVEGCCVGQGLGGEMRNVESVYSSCLSRALNGTTRNTSLEKEKGQKWLGSMHVA